MFSLLNHMFLLKIYLNRKIECIIIKIDVEKNKAYK